MKLLILFNIIFISERSVVSFEMEIVSFLKKVFTFFRDDVFGNKIKKTISSDGIATEQYLDCRGNTVHRSLTYDSRLTETYFDSNGNQVTSSMNTTREGNLIQEYCDSKGRKVYAVHRILENQIYIKYTDADGNPTEYTGYEVDDGTYPQCPSLPPKPNQDPKTVNTVYFKTYVAQSKS
jgi:hypothetical protein